MGQGQLGRLLYVPEMLPRFILLCLLEQYTNTGLTKRSNPVPTRLEICKRRLQATPDLIFSHRQEEWILNHTAGPHTNTHARTLPPSHTHTHIPSTHIYTHTHTLTIISDPLPPLHDVHKELTGVAHGQVEGLARGRQLWGYRGQVTGRGGSRGSPRGGGGGRGERRVRQGRVELLGVWVGVEMRGPHDGVRVRVLRHHHHHHGVVGHRDARRVGGHVRGRRRAVVMRALRGGVAVLAGRRRAVVSSQAAAGGVIRFAAAARAGVGSSSSAAAPRGRLLSAPRGAAGALGASPPLALAPR